jgi:hypothetical protein
MLQSRASLVLVDSQVVGKQVSGPGKWLLNSLELYSNITLSLLFSSLGTTMLPARTYSGTDSRANTGTDSGTYT